MKRNRVAGNQKKGVLSKSTNCRCGVTRRVQQRNQAKPSIQQSLDDYRTMRRDLRGKQMIRGSSTETSSSRVMSRLKGALCVAFSINNRRPSVSRKGSITRRYLISMGI